MLEIHISEHGEAKVVLLAVVSGLGGVLLVVNQLLVVDLTLRSPTQGLGGRQKALE